jgi:hypothetical protein
VPPDRRVRLIILDDWFAQLDPWRFQHGQQRFQVFDPILDLNLAHCCLDAHRHARTSR